MRTDHIRTSSFRSILAMIFLGIATAEGLANDQGTLTVTCLEIRDVNRGAGLAVIIQTPTGKTYLYDTGNGYPEGDGWVGDYNAGRDTILPYLKANGIKALDGVLISHAHFDHFGGLLWLVDHIPIAKLYDSGYHFKGESPPNYVKELAAYEQLRDRFRRSTGAYQEAHTGDRLALDPDLEVEVIAPPRAFFTEPRPDRRPKSDPPAHYLVNANSLGIRIRHQNIVFLLPGDIQSEDQIQSLLPSVGPEKLRCHILIAPGHGIHSTPEFATASRPEVTIASVIRRYGTTSPAPKVFGAVGSQVFITGLHGRITVKSNGIKYDLEVEHPDGAHKGVRSR